MLCYLFFATSTKNTVTNPTANWTQSVGPLQLCMTTCKVSFFFSFLRVFWLIVCSTTTSIHPRQPPGPPTSHDDSLVCCAKPKTRRLTCFGPPLCSSFVFHLIIWFLLTSFFRYYFTITMAVIILSWQPPWTTQRPYDDTTSRGQHGKFFFT
jgi:hypothetical protein